MGEVNVAYAIPENKNATSQKTDSSQGQLKTGAKERQVFPYSDTESVTQGSSEFLQQANQLPEPPPLAGHEIVHFPEEEIALQNEISDMMEELSPKQERTQEQPQTLRSPFSFLTSSKQSTETLTKENKAEQRDSSTLHSQTHSSPNIIHKSIFSLARSFNQAFNPFRGDKGKQQNVEKNATAPASFSQNTQINEEISSQENHFLDQNKDGDSHQGKDQDDQKEQQRDSQEENNPFSLQTQKDSRTSVQKTNSTVARTQKTSSRKRHHHHHSTRISRRKVFSTQRKNQTLYGIDNIFIRFMALMARILGQAEAEAHELYVRIKERTDQIDTLTQLSSKINSEKGSIDWTNNEEMKQLLEKARDIGVDIPQDKFQWSEEEKKSLKENIQMRKDSMEKVTQLERTDMQRYLQEASQCHQARSNILKLLKEVNDTVIHNMRP